MQSPAEPASAPSSGQSSPHTASAPLLDAQPAPAQTPSPASIVPEMTLLPAVQSAAAPASLQTAVLPLPSGSLVPHPQAGLASLAGLQQQQPAPSPSQPDAIAMALPVPAQPQPGFTARALTGLRAGKASKGLGGLLGSKAKPAPAVRPSPVPGFTQLSSGLASADRSPAPQHAQQATQAAEAAAALSQQQRADASGASQPLDLAGSVLSSVQAASGMAASHAPTHVLDRQPDAAGIADSLPGPAHDRAADSAAAAHLPQQQSRAQQGSALSKAMFGQSRAAVPDQV